MWLLPTRGRPELCQKTLDACSEAGMTSIGLVVVDNRTSNYSEYSDLILPGNWFRIDLSFDLAPTKEWFLKNFPNAKFYGLILDDLRPKTPGFDRLLEEAADDWFLADCNDGWITEFPEHVGRIPYPLCGAFCYGAKLVRTVGWWALPGTRQAGSDNAYTEMVNKYIPLRRHLSDVLVEHLNWRTGKRPKDATDDWIRDGVNYIQNDLQVFSYWREIQKYNEIVVRLQQRIADDCIDIESLKNELGGRWPIPFS